MYTWDPNCRDNGEWLRCDGEPVAYLNYETRHIGTKVGDRAVPFPEGVADEQELKAWAIAVVRMGG